MDLASKSKTLVSLLYPVFGSSILGMHFRECIPTRMHSRECIIENAFLLECILENVLSRMHFAKNSAFGKILKLFIRSDYAKMNSVWLVF